MSNEKESLEKLLIFQQDLQSEEECLKKMIAKINAQVHALQVEQLHILNAINKASTNEKTTTKLGEMNLKQESVESESQELDLTVPTFQSSEEDEDDMED